jgi:nucleotide-binding universal stress UspA family protein
MIASILVPLDGSPLAEQALPWGASLARRFGAGLDLVRVHVLYALQEPAAGFGPYDPVMETECKQAEQLYLDGTATMVATVSAMKVTSALVHGFTADGVLERARNVKADLLVMTTHGLGPVGRFFLGSVADELIRQGSVPVLLVPTRDPVPGLIPEPEVERIIIPLDGSALAEQVLQPALELARPLNASCTLLQVLEQHHPSEETQEKAKHYLACLAGRLLDGRLEVQTNVVAGRNAAQAILEEARQEPGSVIAMATHGHPWPGGRPAPASGKRR